MTAHVTPCDLPSVLLDPAATFDTPLAVLQSAQLSSAQQLEILYRWAYDAVELAVAEEEGMTGGEPSLLEAVMRALDELTQGHDGERVAPTKHGAVCRPAQHDGPDEQPGAFASSPCYMHELLRDL